MKTLIIAIQFIIALGIINVWLVRYDRPSKWRGGLAKNMRDEFQAYGLSLTAMFIIGLVKLFLAGLLILGVWIPILVKPAATILALLMLGAVIMHFKVKDPIERSYPALAMLGMSLLVALA